MSREQRFAFAFDLSVEFLAQEPRLAAEWIEAQRARFANVRIMPGPRGGNYRLFTAPDEWRIERDEFWHPGVVRYLTKRWGRYVQPGRLTIEDRLPDVTFNVFNIPVRGGTATLPDGRTIESGSKVISVPVLA